MSVFLTGSLLPQPVIAEEAPEENEEITETVSEEEVSEEEVSEEITEEISEEEQEVNTEEEPAEETEAVAEEEAPETEEVIEEAEEIPAEEEIHEEEPEETPAEEITEAVPEETAPEVQEPEEVIGTEAEPVEEIIIEEAPVQEPEEEVLEEEPAEEPAEEITEEEPAEEPEEEEEVIEETVEETAEEEPAAAVDDDAVQISVGAGTQVSGERGEKAKLAFVPATTGYYKIYSYNNVDSDPQAVLLDEDKNVIEISDDEGENQNFMILRRFEANHAYYVQAYNYNNYEFSYSVTVEEVTYTDTEGDFAYALNGGATITKYLGNASEIVIPSSIGGAAVTAIGNSAFSGYSQITSVTIPSGVVTIDKSAFKNCTGLTSVTIPAGVTGIGTYAFAGCTNLSHINMPASVAETGFRIFENCVSLRSAGPAGSGADYEFGWTSRIPGYAFSGCSEMTQVTIPAGITSIGEAAFDICRKVTEISLPESVTDIGSWAFSECSSLAKIVIPAASVTFGDDAFEYVGGLHTAGLLGSGADYEFGWTAGIPANAFASCSSLTDVVIPETAESIGDAAFYGCTNLTNVTVPAYVEEVGEAALGYYYDSDTEEDAKIEGFTITGYAGTAAESYANENGFAFIALAKTEIPETAVSDIEAGTYNGSALEPAVTVTVEEKQLTEGKDYTVEYANNTNAGTANAVVSGIGKYSGTVTKEFTINKASQKVTIKASAATIEPGKTSTITVTGNQGTVTYKSSDTTVATVSKTGVVTGKKAGTVTISAVAAATENYKKKTATVTIKVILSATSKIAVANKENGIKVAWKAVEGATGYKVYRNGKLAKTITSGTTVSWGDTKATTNGGKYTYKITATSDAGESPKYKEITTYWLKRPAIASTTNTAADKITVKWAKNTAATGYQIQYSTSSGFTSSTTKTVTITANTTVSRAIASLKIGKKYYFRLRSYKIVGSAKYYSMWSAVKNQIAYGWRKESGKWYYYKTDGKKQKGWLKLDGKWYYFDSNYAMVTGTKKIGTKTYTFNSSGVCQNP